MSGVASTLAKKRAEAASGFGTNANAVKYLNQNFESLRSECLSRGQLFCDTTFPAAPESLGFNELGPRSPKTRGVEWKRPGVSSYESNINVVLPKQSSKLMLSIYGSIYVAWKIKLLVMTHPLKIELESRQQHGTMLFTITINAFYHFYRNWPPVRSLLLEGLQEQIFAKEV